MNVEPDPPRCDPLPSRARRPTGRWRWVTRCTTSRGYEAPIAGAEGIMGLVCFFPERRSRWRRRFTGASPHCSPGPLRGVCSPGARCRDVAGCTSHADRRWDRDGGPDGLDHRGPMGRGSQPNRRTRRRMRFPRRGARARTAEAVHHRRRPCGGGAPARSRRARNSQQAGRWANPGARLTMASSAIFSADLPTG
jgi:hypothetical protein